MIKTTHTKDPRNDNRRLHWIGFFGAALSIPGDICVQIKQMFYKLHLQMLVVVLLSIFHLCQKWTISTARKNTENVVTNAFGLYSRFSLLTQTELKLHRKIIPIRSAHSNDDSRQNTSQGKRRFVHPFSRFKTFRYQTWNSFFSPICLSYLKCHNIYCSNPPTLSVRRFLFPFLKTIVECTFLTLFHLTNTFCATYCSNRRKSLLKIK